MTAATRLDALPDMPTISEFVPGYEASACYGIGVPKGTPPEIVDKLNEEINAVWRTPSSRRVSPNWAPTPADAPADFGKLMADETAKWAKVIKSAGIKAE